MANFIFDYDKGRHKGIVQSDYLDNLREHFSVEDPVAKIKQIRFGRYMPTRLYAITPSGRFDIGLFEEIAKYISSLEIKYKVIITQPFKDAFNTGYTFDKERLSVLGIPLRDYQEEVVKTALTRGTGTIVVATAGGKTLIMATLIKTIRDNTSKNHKTLIMVPGIQLVEQTYNDLIEYGIDKNIMCKWSGNNKLDKDAKIIVVSLNILQSKKTDLSILEDIDLLIVDEVHKFRKDNKINKILKHIKTPNTFGLTGTMPENKVDEWNIVGKIGPIIFEKSSADLRDEDYIADASIQVLYITYTKPLIYKTQSSFLDPTAKYNEENEFIYNHTYRNGVITKISKSVDKNILILVDRISHGEKLKKLIEKKVPEKTVYFIRGSVAVKEREKLRSLMESSDKVVCIAITKIFSTGINIKNLHYILFASAGKAKIKIIQSIGRGLRLHENKTKLVIFDIADKLIYGTKHLRKRLNLYKREKIKYGIKEIKER